MSKKLKVYGCEYDVEYDTEVVRANRKCRRYIVNGSGLKDRYLLTYPRESVQQALECIIDRDRDAALAAYMAA